MARSSRGRCAGLGAGPRGADAHAGRRPGRKRPSRPRPPTPRARLPTAAPTVAPTVDDARSAAPTDDGGDRAPARRHDAAAEGDPLPRARLGGPHGAEHRRRHHRRADRPPSRPTHLRSPRLLPGAHAALPRAGLGGARRREIWGPTAATLADVAGRVTSEGGRIAAIGITTSARRPSRGTAPPAPAAPGDRCGRPPDGRPVRRARAIGPRADGESPHRSGARPVLLGHKFAWMLSEGVCGRPADLALGTVDSWLLWRLTGGPGAGVHATDPSTPAAPHSSTSTRSPGPATGPSSSASRCGPCPRVRPTSGRFGVTDPPCAAGLRCR